jgi:hypothetical protein
VDPDGRGLRDAATFALDPVWVGTCLDVKARPVDALFQRAWTSGLAAISRIERRGRLAGVTGHMAESVVELMLDGYGYHLIWHFSGPGRHGIDLLALAPCGDRLVAIEVKGTLRHGVWPRLTRGELVQMSAAWLDKSDNPGMADWELGSADVYGAVVLVNFADAAYRIGFTADFSVLHPVHAAEQIVQLDWLETRQAQALGE